MEILVVFQELDVKVLVFHHFLNLLSTWLIKFLKTFLTTIRKLFNNYFLIFLVIFLFLIMIFSMIHFSVIMELEINRKNPLQINLIKIILKMMTFLDLVDSEIWVKWCLKWTIWEIIFLTMTMIFFQVDLEILLETITNNQTHPNKNKVIVVILNNLKLQKQLMSIFF